jgi:acyl transferase domain-containing protein
LYNTAEEQSAIGRPELSQPICTAIQVAIVDLLSSWKVRVSTVVGHSSGEIAAAYASGAVSRESAWMLAYFRGLAVAIARDFVSSVGSMVAVLATPDSMAPLLETHNAAHPQDQAVVACYNSPSNLTISGSRDAIDRLKTALTDASITFRLLNVDVAYHSHHMDPIANIYKKLLRQIQPGEQYENQPRLVSTVTGKPLEDETVLTRAEYWMRNLIAPVQFSMALAPVCAGGARQSNAMAADLFIEIGPHSALRSPLKDMLKSNGRDVMTDYTPVLVRNRNAAITALECAGKLYLSGTSIDLAEVNQSHRPSVNLVTTLPPYPFNDKTKYWLEGRASAQYRFRNYVHHEFLGTRVDDWNEREARWTNRIILDQSPWLKDHRVNGSIIFPAAGFMVMTLEAARQFYGIRDSVVGYSMRDIIFPKAVEISQDPRGTELQLTLHTTNTSQRSSEPVRVWNQFSIFVYENAGWVECCSGSIAVEYEVEERQISEIDERKELLSASMRSLKNAYEECSDQIDSSDIYNAFEQAGLPYGPFFRALQDVKWNKCDQATGSINLQQWRSLHEAFTDPHLIHPTALDAILQLTFPAFSIYSKNASATTVPIGLRSAWFSSHITQDTPNLKAMIHAKVIERGFRNKSFSITAALADGDAPFFFGEMETSTIGTSNLSSDVENKPLYKIEYQPDIDLLPERTLYLKPSLTKDPSLVYDKELLCVASMRNALEQTSNVANLPMQLQNHVQWMEAQVKKKPVTSSESVESMCQRLEHIDTETRLLVRVARNLPSILAGEMDQPNLLFADNILSDFYSNFYSNNELLSRAAEEIRLLAYKYPAMKVLEIGAGTGSTTEHILGALGKEFTEYVYTDITPTSFVKAKERFASPKLTFKTLDISQDPIPQGYTEGSFDLIIAANVSLDLDLVTHIY